MEKNPAFQILGTALLRHFCRHYDIHCIQTLSNLPVLNARVSTSSYRNEHVLLEGLYTQLSLEIAVAIATSE